MNSQTAKALLIILGLSVLLTAGIFVHEYIYDQPVHTDSIYTSFYIAGMYTSIFFCLLSAIYIGIRAVILLFARLTR